MLLLVLCHLYCRPCLLYFCRLLVTCVWHDLSDNFFVRQKSYDFCRLSDISLRGNIIRTVLYCQCATSSKGTVNKNGSYSLVGPRVFLFGFLDSWFYLYVFVCFVLPLTVESFPLMFWCWTAGVTNLNESSSSFLLPPITADWLILLNKTAMWWGVIYVTGLLLLNRRCTIFLVCFHSPKHNIFWLTDINLLTKL